MGEKNVRLVCTRRSPLIASVTKNKTTSNLIVYTVYS